MMNDFKDLPETLNFYFNIGITLHAIYFLQGELIWEGMDAHVCSNGFDVEGCSTYILCRELICEEVAPPYNKQ